LIPAEADALLEVKDPRKLATTVVGLELLEQLKGFPAVKEQIDSTSARRGRQLLAYFEKELGGKWPDLLDGLAGGGAALGVKFSPSSRSGPPLLLLAVQGKDEKLLAKFVKTFLAVAEGELARQESKQKVTKKTYHGVETIHVGKDLHLARAGKALLVSNKEEALRRGLNLHLGREKKSLASSPKVAEAERLLPRDPLVNAWVSLEPLHKSKQGQDLYKTPREFPPFTVLFGNYFDVVGRSPFLALGVHPQKDGFLTAIRFPRGREGMGNDRLLHLPPEGQPGSKALLEPKGVLYSASFYLDIPAIWKERDKLFPKDQAAGMDRFDRRSGAFLAGTRLSSLLSWVGTYHRLVVTTQGKVGYKKEPRQRFPAFAFIHELREPEKFGRSMDTILRGVGLLVTTQVKLKLVEEKRNGVAIVGYRFDEKAPLKNDVNDVRFNFSPCYARVGKQFVFCSTVELCRELVDLLQAEEKSPGPTYAATVRDRFYARGAADLLKSVEDQLITQAILDQAVSPGEAKEQVAKFIALVRKLGHASLETTILPKEFRYDIRVRTGKKD
jgi:hypothetical protein